jgi:hypothetical protein
VLDVALVALVLVVCVGLGLPVTELLPARFAGRALVAPVLGLAVLGVVAPATYRWGVSPRTLLVASAIAALAGIAWWCRRIARREITRASWRLAAVFAASWLAVLLIMMLPRWVGGEQFSVFQGNMWDAFGYLESALVYARRSYAAIVAADNAELVKTPLMSLAQAQLAERPSVHLLYAAFTRITPDEAYRMSYPFLVALQSQCLLVGIFVLRAVLPAARPAAWIAAAASFPLGFWGQYAFDINAWSQIASSPLLLLMVGLVLHATIALPARGDDVRIAVVLAILVAGAVCLYPEGLTPYAAALGGFAICVHATRMIRARRFAPRALLPLAGVGGLAAIALYPPLAEFLIKQVSRASTDKWWFWSYFQGFFAGRDMARGQPSDFVAGLFGMYFATPSASAPAALAALQRAVVIAVIAGAIAALAAVRERDLPRASRSLLLGWAAIAVLLLLPAGALWWRETYWAAGKAVSYAAPVYMLLLAAPIAFHFAHGVLRPLRWAAIALVAFQLALGVARIPAAGSPDGIHYAEPYPAVSEPRFKHDIGWNLRGLDGVLTADQTVLLQPMDPLLEAYVMMYLYAHRIRFAKVTPVNSHFSYPGGGHDLGTMYLAEPDVEISFQRTGYVLHYRDGRPDRWIGSRGE